MSALRQYDYLIDYGKQSSKTFTDREYMVTDLDVKRLQPIGDRYSHEYLMNDVRTAYNFDDALEDIDRVENYLGFQYENIDREMFWKNIEPLERLHVPTMPDTAEYRVHTYRNN